MRKDWPPADRTRHAPTSDHVVRHVEHRRTLQKQRNAKTKLAPPRGRLHHLNRSILVHFSDLKKEPVHAKSNAS